MSAVRWLLVLAGVALAVAGGVTIAGQAGAGQQPWDPELSDNFVFVKAIPFVLGLGVVFALLRRRPVQVERSDGRVRRFSRGTIAGHWLITIGFLLALPTGMWQYLGGILDVRAPIDLYLFYRVHYVGGAIVLFSVAYFATSWWVTGERSLLPPRGEWRAHLAGAARDLPAALVGPFAKLLRLDLANRLPSPTRFTYYETGFSFPTWSIGIALITVTGLVKAMRYVYPVPGPILYWSSTLHVLAMVLLVLKVLDHLRYTFPRWPLMVAIVKGWIGESALRGILRAPASGAVAPGADAAGSRVGATSGSDS